MRRERVLLCVSVGFALIAGEMAARFILPEPLPWIYPQLRYRPDPHLVFSLVPDQMAFVADKPVRINSLGFRGAMVANPPTPGQIRLLWLGDSIVFGFGVADDDIVSRRVEIRLGQKGINAESINTAVPAYNTEQEIAFLEHDGVQYHPDWVILGFCWNDINDWLGARVCPNGWLVSVDASEGSCTSSFLESPRGYAIRNLLKRSRFAYGLMESARAVHERISPDPHTLFRSEILEGRDTDRVREGWERVESALKRFAALGRKAGFRTLIVAFPLPLALGEPFPRSEYPSRLGAIARRANLPFLDLEPSFKESYRGHDSLFLPYDADHPNAAGHDLAAREVAAYLLAHVRDPR